MQIRGQFSNFFYSTMLPALNAKIWQNFRAKPKMYDKLMHVDSTGRSIEQYAQMAGVGLPSLIPEGAETPLDTMVQGFSKTYQPLKYGLGIAASQELVEDDKFGVISRRTVALSNSINQSIEIQAASVYNNGFVNTILDGQPLFSASHPLVKAGGVQNNLLSVAADLDPASLELALTDWELTRSQEGFLQMQPTPRVVVASANRWNVAEILKSQQRSDTANNATNAFKFTEAGGTVESICWPYLTDPDGWFLAAPPDECEILWLWRKQPYTKSDYVENKETGYVFMRYRADFGPYGYRGVYGTPGA